MFRPGLLLVVFCLAMLAHREARAGTPDGAPIGRWLTTDRSAVIQIGFCKVGICGAIVGIRQNHPGDPMPDDWRGRPECGITMIEASPVTTSGGKTVWKGYVLDPRNGALHRAVLTLDGANRLVLRGYVLIPLLGRSQAWTAYTGPTLPGCHLPG